MKCIPENGVTFWTRDAHLKLPVVAVVVTSIECFDVVQEIGQNCPERKYPWLLFSFHDNP
jgi:hypothetical protein